MFQTMRVHEYSPFCHVPFLDFMPALPEVSLLFMNLPSHTPPPRAFPSHFLSCIHRGGELLMMGPL